MLCFRRDTRLYVLDTWLPMKYIMGYYPIARWNNPRGISGNPQELRDIKLRSSDGIPDSVLFAKERRE